MLLFHFGYGLHKFIDHEFQGTSSLFSINFSTFARDIINAIFCRPLFSCVNKPGKDVSKTEYTTDNKPDDLLLREIIIRPVAVQKYDMRMVAIHFALACAQITVSEVIPFRWLD